MFGTPNYNYGYPWNSAGVQNTSQTQPQQSGIVWVSGIEGAKSYIIGMPNQSVLLMDSESNTFYIKTTDQSGIPMPLRIFDYTERITKQEPVKTADYITREEFEKRLEELSNAKQSVPTA